MDSWPEFQIFRRGIAAYNAGMTQSCISMVFQLSQLPANFVYGIAAIAAAIVIVAKLSQGPNLDAVPTVGTSNWLGSWWATLNNSNPGEIVREGYKKHPSAAFKYIEHFQWMVVVSSRKHIDELRRAPDDVMSLDQAINERINTHYTLAADLRREPYHINVVRSQLTRNIGTLYPNIMDEIVTAFNDVLDLKGNEWKSVPALNTVRQVVCRTSNRLFLGLPLCRNPDWIDLNIRYTIDVFTTGLAIAQFPKFLKPIAAYFLTSNIRKGKARCLKLVGPIVEERLKYMNEHASKWGGKPNDLISWLMEEAKGSQLTVEALSTRLLVVNFAAIHTSSNSFTHALFYLAAYPQYIQPLREEVEAIIKEEGWSKDSLDKMFKIDSFLRESQRLRTGGYLSVMRKALKDFTFSDGTFIPKGTLIGVAARPLHYDEKFYERPHVFDPFRFAHMREEDPSVKCQFVSTGSEYLTFGYGRHACPGRFFAANELKSMLAHVVVTYDVKLEGGGTRPQDVRYAPNPYARVLFRKRVD